MPARRHSLDGVEPELGLVDDDGLQELDHHLQHLDVEHQLLERGRESSFLPAGRVVDEVAVPEYRAPQGHLRLVGALRVGDVRGAGIGGPVRQAIAARELAAGDVRLRVLGCSKGGRPGTHVDIRGERAVHHRRSGAHGLREHHAEQGLGILLCKRGGEAHGSHGAHQGEGRDDDRLSVHREGDEALAHRLVEAARAVHGNDGDEARAVRDLLEVEAAGDRNHSHGIERAPRADRRAMKYPVRVDQVCAVGIEMPRVRGHLDGRAHLVAQQVNGVEILRQTDEITVIPEVAGPAAALAVVDVRRPCHEPEVDAVAAHHDAPCRVARLQDEGGGGGRERLLHQPSIQPHHGGRRIDLSAGRGEKTASAIRHDLDAELLEDSQRCQMHRLELLGGQHLHGRVGIVDFRPGQLRDGGAVQSPAPASLTAAGTRQEEDPGRGAPLPGARWHTAQPDTGPCL